MTSSMLACPGLTVLHLGISLSWSLELFAVSRKSSGGLQVRRTPSKPPDLGGARVQCGTVHIDATNGSFLGVQEQKVQTDTIVSQPCFNEPGTLAGWMLSSRMFRSEDTSKRMLRPCSGLHLHRCLQGGDHDS